MYQQLIDAMGVLLEGATAVFVPDAARISGDRIVPRGEAGR